MQEIKSVIFDYGNVIAKVDHMKFFKAVEPHSSLSPQQMFEEHRKEPNLIVEYESGRMSSDAFIATSIDRLRLSLTHSEFHQAFTNIFERIQPTINLIKQLQPHYKIALLSNTNEMHFRTEIETVDVFPLFGTVTLSYEVGAMKPSLQIYADALAKLALEARECVYVDDIPEYVQAAASVGINAVHYRSHEQLLASLHTIGVRNVT